MVMLRLTNFSYPDMWLHLWLFYRKMDILKRFRKRRINVFAISTQSLLLLKENDATGENEDSPYIQYREELLEYVDSL